MGANPDLLPSTTRPEPRPVSGGVGSPTARLTRADVLRAADVAAMTGLSVSTVYDWARQGKLPCRRRGNVRIFLRSEVERWLLDPDADF